jgi:hypothetical protein
LAENYFFPTDSTLEENGLKAFLSSLRLKMELGIKTYQKIAIL